MHVVYLTGLVFTNEIRAPRFGFRGTVELEARQSRFGYHDSIFAGIEQGRTRSYERKLLSDSLIPIG
jgi:hypothetical protein